MPTNSSSLSSGAMGFVYGSTSPVGMFCLRGDDGHEIYI